MASTEGATYATQWPWKERLRFEVSQFRTLGAQVCTLVGGRVMFPSSLNRILHSVESVSNGSGGPEMGLSKGDEESNEAQQRSGQPEALAPGLRGADLAPNTTTHHSGFWCNPGAHRA